MTDKEWLSKVALAARVYNEQRLCRDFQAAEIDKFVQWMHKEYGIEFISNK